MSWFLNQYVCPECEANWDDQWSSMSDDTCPDCDYSDISPVHSVDLSICVQKDQEGNCLVLVSREDAEDDPAYVELAKFSSSEVASIASAHPLK